MKKERLKWVMAMIAADGAIGGFLYMFTENWRLSLAAAGVLLLTDLYLAPKILPHIFKDKE